MDELTLTIRMHDPKEKTDPTKAASWVVLKVPREDVGLSAQDVVSRYITPSLGQLNQLHLK